MRAHRYLSNLIWASQQPVFDLVKARQLLLLSTAGPECRKSNKQHVSGERLKRRNQHSFASALLLRVIVTKQQTLYHSEFLIGALMNRTDDDKRRYGVAIPIRRSRGG